MKQPHISVIIPIPPEGECDISLNSLRRQNYDKRKIEVLVTIGRHRSIQRNEALKKTTGEFIFFLDNDVHIPDRNYINRHLAYYYNDDNVVSVGGPSLTLDTDSVLQKAFGQIFQSYFAMQAVRARYSQVGKIRKSDEKELIFCNQSMHSSPVKKIGGFNTQFHSGNEEKELINRLIQNNYTLIYDPDIVVYRSQRKTLREFIKQIAKYGKSRIEHFVIKPSSLEVKFAVPLFFLLYLVSLIFVVFFPLPQIIKFFYGAPLIVYVALAVVATVQAFFRTKNFLVSIITLFLYPVHHISYALGNIFALYRFIFPQNRNEPDTIIKKVRV